MARRNEGHHAQHLRMGALANKSHFSDSDSDGTTLLRQRSRQNQHPSNGGKKDEIKPPRRRRAWGVPSLLSRQGSVGSIDTGFGPAHDLVLRDGWRPNKELTTIKRTTRANSAEEAVTGGGRAAVRGG
ncbi:unnamed protein product, partial [Choristocarpus tenellus]